MNFTILITLFMINLNQNDLILYDFSSYESTNYWRIVNDGVMGGLSNGAISQNNNGNGVFSGEISLKNNGGFSMTRLRFPIINVSEYNGIRLKLKGDGKKYQFRIKSDYNNYYSYVTSFSTSGNWEEIVVKFEDFTPQYRGRKLNRPNYNGEFVGEVAFLIGNKVQESFQLEIDKIILIK